MSEHSQPRLQRWTGGVRFLVLGLALLTGLQLTHAQWDSDAQNPTYHWDYMRSSAIATDRLGGAFFAMSPGGSTTQYVGHVNADGFFTFPLDDPYPGMVPADLAGYGASNEGLTLIASEPPGTVIGLSPRIQQSPPVYEGPVFVKFDTMGLTGFGRVTVSDNIHYLIFGNPEDRGYIQAESDGHGGLHVLFSTQFTVPFYYNHLEEDGDWTHPLPGIAVGGVYGAGLYPEGYGGVFVLWRWPDDHPTHPRALVGRRFDADGLPQWEEEGRFLIRYIGGGFADLLGPGRMLFAIDSMVSSVDYIHYLFMIDTSGAHLWNPDGLLFAEDYPRFHGPSSILADSTGGFLHNRVISQGVAQSYRYDQNAELLATSEPQHSVYRPDGTGGGYLAYADQHHPQLDSITLSVWRWNSDLTFSWSPDSLTALEISETLFGFRDIVAETNGIIAMTYTGAGIVFSHVTPQGTLGPRLDSPGPPSLPVVSEIKILDIYPNPFNSSANIQISAGSAPAVQLFIFDILGRVVHDETIARQSGPIVNWVWSAPGLSSGQYFLRLTDLSDVQAAPTSAKQIILLK